MYVKIASTAYVHSCIFQNRFPPCHLHIQTSFPAILSDHKYCIASRHSCKSTTFVYKRDKWALLPLVVVNFAGQLQWLKWCLFPYAWERIWNWRYFKRDWVSVWGEKCRVGRLYRVMAHCHSSFPISDNQFMAKVTWIFNEGSAWEQNFPIYSAGKLCLWLLLHNFHDIINILQQCVCIQ